MDHHKKDLAGQLVV